MQKVEMEHSKDDLDFDTVFQQLFVSSKTSPSPQTKRNHNHSVKPLKNLVSHEQLHISQLGFSVYSFSCLVSKAGLQFSKNTPMTNSAPVLHQLETFLKKALLRRSKSLSNVWNHSWDMLSIWDGLVPSTDINRVRSVQSTYEVDSDGDSSNQEVQEQMNSPPLTLRMDESLWVQFANQEGLRIDGDGKIIGGTLDKLTNLLTDMNLEDEEYIPDFLYTFRSFMSPRHLFERLALKFYTESVETEEKKRQQKAVQLRIVQVLRKWMNVHYYDFADDSYLFDKVIQFLDDFVSRHLDYHWVVVIKSVIQEKHPTQPFALSASAPLEIIEGTIRRDDCHLKRHIVKKNKFYYRSIRGNELIDWLDEHLFLNNRAQANLLANKILDTGLLKSLKVKVTTVRDDPSFFYRLRSGFLAQGPPPKSNIPRKIDENYLRLLDIDPEEAARQLTLISEHQFHQITVKDLTDLKIYTNKQKSTTGKNIQRVSDRFDHVSYWVATEIVLSPNLHQRKTLIKRFIAIANELEKLRNYNDLVAIIAGLSNGAVTRLKDTWREVGTNITKAFETLEEFYSPVNQRNIRDIHKTSEPPCIPFIGLWVADLIRLEEVPDELENNLINFHKMRIISNMFKQLEKFKSVKYNLKPVQEYQNFLTHSILVVKDHTLLRKHSMNIESHVRES